MQSRLARHQKKQLRTVVVIVIVFIILFFSVGIPLLAQGSFFLTSIFRGKDTLESLTNQVLGNVEINDVPEATNSAEFLIYGSAENFDKVDFFLNGDKVKEIKISSKSDFSEVIGSLKPGDNEFYAVGISKNNLRKKSDKFTISYKKDKPRLDISQPHDNDKVTKSDITMSGQTDKGDSVFLNNLPVVVDSDGKFNSQLSLKEGENKISVRAQDDAGNIAEKTITVTYEKD